jgi:photosystem II stability/assembly factor-like uncharacterized protein
MSKVMKTVVALVALTLGAGAPVGADGSNSAASVLPKSPHYHSLLVSPTNPNDLVLGTHTGLYVSTDAGRHWRFDALKGNDAMGLARPDGDTIWLTGHYVFKKSTDAGTTWVNVRPAGLPTRDIHAFAVDPRSPKTLYAAVAGIGLFRSTNDGRSFSLVSAKRGGAFMALLVLQDGRILAGDYLRGLLQSTDRGRSWKRVVRATILRLAVNPKDPRRVLASTAGIALSTDEGKTWRLVLNLPKGVGPIAWSRSDPKLAYAVGLNRVFYRSTDSGQSWQAVKT